MLHVAQINSFLIQYPATPILLNDDYNLPLYFNIMMYCRSFRTCFKKTEMTQVQKEAKEFIRKQYESLGSIK